MIHTTPTDRPGRGTAPLAGEASVTARPDEAIIREPECRRLTGLSRSTRWRLERDGLFPKRRQISPGCSGWLASEIRAWLAAR
jgi:prophage regulatory protein